MTVQNPRVGFDIATVVAGKDAASATVLPSVVGETFVTVSLNSGDAHVALPSADVGNIVTVAMPMISGNPGGVIYSASGETIVGYTSSLGLFSATAIGVIPGIYDIHGMIRLLRTSSSQWRLV